MLLHGKAFKFGNDVNTDYIISGKHKFKTLDMKELARHVMEDLDPHFYEKITEGDMIVAGSNFGCGSSREHAPLAIKAAGVSCVIAGTFARIFFRNAINIGLPLLECEQAVSGTESGDILEVDLASGKIKNLTSGKVFAARPYPDFMAKLISSGGLIEYTRKRLANRRI